ncbi:hypothetical protein NDU88_004940 [Pleurodeles waltl]|uniref:Uncharacterized protein n=1 Tax=Pleurodeles waltl TaxID=8319 RepID=A0AAV7NPY9_PLEWA|nr:hypothetical protein NDU88_004940 [Pleurodeles waltl]
MCLEVHLGSFLSQPGWCEPAASPELCLQHNRACCRGQDNSKKRGGGASSAPRPWHWASRRATATQPHTRRRGRLFSFIRRQGASRRPRSAVGQTALAVQPGPSRLVWEAFGDHRWHSYLLF